MVTVLMSDKFNVKTCVILHVLVFGFAHFNRHQVCWNAPFKANYRELCEAWLSEGEHTFTPGGNMRAPSKVLMATWVKKAWDRVSSDIKKLFKVLIYQYNLLS